jgi:nicotinamide mononucleotide transporter
MDLLNRLLEAKLDWGPGVYWREIVGNVFGLASALLGMRRRVSAWGVGIVGNVLLFTVFIGGALGGPFGEAGKEDLWGQAGRQVFFVIVSVYGWVRWSQFRRQGGSGGAGVNPTWAGLRGRLELLIGAVVLWVAFYFILGALHSYNAPADAWILTGSILATYGMARGWVEFWLVWVAVDVVGVPLAFDNGLPVSGMVYGVFFVMVVAGVRQWIIKARTRSVPAVATSPAIELREVAV